MKQTEEEKTKSTPEGEFVSIDTLLEIAGIRHSLEVTLLFWYESSFEEYGKAAVMIEPAVKRLAAICKENNFPE